jgi:pimeloyl-ACP methyl ester carboxylesterase
LFFLNSAWWTLLLLSAFVSPPGLTTRGDGFTALAFATLTGGNLLVALLFFTTPSKGMRLSSAFLAAILLLDALLVLSVGQTRTEEGAVGVASVLWALGVAAWSVIADWVVAAAKSDEEIRLTGRPETRRTVKEWLAVLVANIVLVVFVAVAFLMTVALILRAHDASLKPVGERYRVDGGKYAVHLACVGNATKTGERAPTVLLESGENPSEASLERWLHAAHKNGTVARYCFWDRPGYAWSDNAPSPHSAGMAATALAETLAHAGEEGPWISVSAGYGSVVARIFSSRQRREVRGLLLADPLHEDLLGQLGSPARSVGLWLGGVLSPLGLRRVPGALWGGRSREDRLFGRRHPGGKLLKARLQESLVAGSLTRREVESARAIQDEQTPLVVISSGVECSHELWRAKQEDLTTLTKRLLDWVVVPGAPHEVWRTEEGRGALDLGLARLLMADKFAISDSLA